MVYGPPLGGTDEPGLVVAGIAAARQTSHFYGPNTRPNLQLRASRSDAQESVLLAMGKLSRARQCVHASGCGVQDCLAHGPISIANDSRNVSTIM